MPDTLGLLSSLADSFRATCGEGRRRIDCGPFALYVSDESDAYLMNVATPVAAEADWDRAVQDLVDAFRGAGRRPRLEFFRELVPDLEAALRRAGLALEMEAPVMVLTPEALTDGRCAGRSLAAGDAAGLAAMEGVQRAAYGEMLTEEAQAGFRPLLLAGLASGGVRAGLLEEEGRPVAAAMLMVAPAAVELAGVGTDPDARGRGHAEALCRLLLREHFAAGGPLAWLSAAPSAQALYRRLGFQVVGTQLNMGAGET